MPLLTPSGTTAADLNVAGTTYTDISPALLTSMVLDNALLGMLDVGEETPQEVFTWNEGALNPQVVTCTSTLPDGVTATMTFSAADAAVIRQGAVLQEDLLVGQSEQIRVITKAGQTMTVLRGYGGTTPAAHQGGAANVKYRIISETTYENSDLGPDESRPRIAKSGFIQRDELNVNLSSEAIIKSLAGYVPGVENEMVHQFTERMIELRRRIAQSVIFGIKDPGNPGNSWSTTSGLIPWYDGTENSSTTTVDTAETINPVTNVNAFQIINNIVTSIFRVGGFSNAIVTDPDVMNQIGAMFAGQIRLDQNDRNRGYYAKYVTPGMGNEHLLVNEAYFPASAGKHMMWIGDLSRCRIRPFMGSLLMLIMAPSFRAGDACRALSMWGFEARNTGSDSGQSAVLHRNLDVA